MAVESVRGSVRTPRIPRLVQTFKKRVTIPGNLSWRTPVKGEGERSRVVRVI